MCESVCASVFEGEPETENRRINCSRVLDVKRSLDVRSESSVSEHYPGIKNET